MSNIPVTPPYLDETHHALRDSIKRFVDKEILPYHNLWEKDGIVPKDIWLKAGEIGLLCPNIPKEYGGIGGDFRFNVIVIEELADSVEDGEGKVVIVPLSVLPTTM